MKSPQTIPGGDDRGDRVDAQLRRMLMLIDQLLSERHVRLLDYFVRDGRAAIDDAERLPQRRPSLIVSGEFVKTGSALLADCDWPDYAPRRKLPLGSEPPVSSPELPRVALRRNRHR
jgi:hypothetical protein